MNLILKVAGFNLRYFELYIMLQVVVGIQKRAFYDIFMTKRTA